MAVYYWTKHKTKLKKLLIFILIALYMFIIKPLEKSNNNRETDSGDKHKEVTSEDVNTHSGKRVLLEQCNCTRVLPTNTIPEEDYSSTTCSKHAWYRGAGQRVVGFSYYGDSASDHHKSKGYLQGIEDNMRAINKFYPGWTMRLYYDLPPADPILDRLCSLACSDPNLDLCYIRDLPGTPMKNAKEVFAMNWRFFPTLDSQVEYFVSRDLDSLFSDREKAAVSAWLKSGKAHHMMRDHPQHAINMLGSAWGSWLRDDNVREQWKDAWYKAKDDVEVMWAARYLVGPDQGFLRRYVWKWAKKDALQHDAYSCKIFPGTVGFPTQRRNTTNNFVASVYSQEMYLWEKCPYKCRPELHKDWEYC